MSIELPVILSPHAQVLLRGVGAVQFGLDAARAGILETPAAATVAETLRRLSHPTDLDHVLEELIAAGLAVPAAISLLEELLLHGVIRPARRPQVFLLGATPLATWLARLLEHSGITVRIPLADEDLHRALTGLNPTWPIVLADQLGARVELAQQLTQLPNPTITASVFDRRGLVGPALLGDQGPCLVCVELYWVRRDEHFHTVISQARDAGPMVRQDPSAVAATAASTVALVQRLHGFPLGSTSPPAAPVVPGECLVVDPYLPEQAHRFRIRSFSGCPVCFEASAPAQRNWWSTPKSSLP